MTTIELVRKHKLVDYNKHYYNVYGECIDLHTTFLLQKKHT